ncbi:MAG: tRNA uridine-5-carboxymethylaminomethyl(34) synthesis GTPase MnmE [Bacteroidetes bacterium]|uniref:tRNA modification GTPase MnmE n=1 Tax=Candidatus Limisoma faecipullorum TaxID=2840854 RepID=A0A9D9NK34_9BACT|nr:tRNA uridine-5-carboxymethylaminomethyl(34) synthesis GTPase MnmE [Candidatus Limisoma faecipullorum]
MEQLSKTYGEDTICAISTPAGVGGIAVVRVSGSKAVEYVMKSWRGYDLRKAATHTAHFGRIVYPDGETLDEVVATVFLCPHSFTGEDTVELSCHGSQWIQTQLVTLMLRNGCRAAEGGEFTRRAFMNGKIDLSQAEAIADVIASSSRASHRVAISQMRGGFSEMLARLREQLLEFVSLMELELDFSEEDVEFADRSRLTDLARHIDSVITSLADSFSVGNAIKNGVPVAIVGETNAGKSTLLNRLLHDDKAIVSDIRGTTRDAIEDTINLGGITFRFIDTAGIRDTSDKIESIGIDRTFQKIDNASVILWMIDGTQGTGNIRETAERIMPHCQGKQLIAVINKSDKLDNSTIQAIQSEISHIHDGISTIAISAKNDIAVDRLEKMLVESAGIPENDPNAVVVTNARHYGALCHAQEAIRRAITGLQSGLSGDFVSQDIRECMHYLGEITGEITTHEILGSIFSRFCIGK